MKLVVIEEKRSKMIMWVTEVNKLKDSKEYVYKFALFISSDENHRWDWDDGILRFDDSISTNRVTIDYPLKNMMKLLIHGVFNARI